jgi:hypothetical protein
MPCMSMSEYTLHTPVRPTGSHRWFVLLLFLDGHCAGTFMLLVDGIQVHKVVTVSRSKSGNVWIHSTVCTLATLGAHSPSVHATQRIYLKIGSNGHIGE